LEDLKSELHTENEQMRKDIVVLRQELIQKDNKIFELENNLQVFINKQEELENKIAIRDVCINDLERKFDDTRGLMA
jgi:chromosome segregation ATPase